MAHAEMIVIALRTQALARASESRCPPILVNLRARPSPLQETGYGETSNALLGTTDLIVDGGVDEVRLYVNGVSLHALLAALAEKYEFNLTIGKELQGKISGAYRGSLKNILARLLKDENFVMHELYGGLSLHVYSDKTAKSEEKGYAPYAAGKASLILNEAPRSVSREAQPADGRSFVAEAPYIQLDEQFLGERSARLIRIVLEGLRGESSVAELCRREGVAESLYHAWSREFLEAGAHRLAGGAATADGEVDDLRHQTRMLKEVVVDQALSLRQLKGGAITTGTVEE